MDFNNILNKFNDLGIVNKGFTPDDPVAVAQQEKKMMSPPSTEQSHARMVSESVAGKHIPGVSDIKATDMAALAGVSRTTNVAPQMTMSVDPTPPQRPSPSQPNPNINLDTVLTRLDAIETKLQKVFEAIEPAQPMQEGNLTVKRREFTGNLAMAMDQLVDKSKDNEKVINTIQKLYKLATGKDVTYDPKHDTFTVIDPRQRQEAPKPSRDYDSLFKDYLRK